MDVDSYRIVNVYKPPPTRLQASDLPVFPRPVLCAGDLSTNQLRLYCRTSSTDGECLVAWESLNGFVPLHDPKDVATFHSGRWNTGTNPDLTFVCVDPDRRVPDRRIFPLERPKFFLQERPYRSIDPLAFKSEERPTQLCFITISRREPSNYLFLHFCSFLCYYGFIFIWYRDIFFTTWLLHKM